jgi:hypothetical protein
MYDEKAINEVVDLTNILYKQCKKNMQDIELIIVSLDKLLNGNSESVASSTVVKEKNQQDYIKEIDSSLESHDFTIDRRIELHKELGSYEPAKKVEVEIDFPTITPLSKLNKNEQNELYKKIFEKATYYVKTILQLDKYDKDYVSQITQEADRVLSVWIETNRY